MGDNSFLINVPGRAFGSYVETGQSLISKGDPVEAEGSGRQLIWALRELADRTGRLCASRAVTPKYVTTHLGMGLSALRFGEVARVVPTGPRLAVPPQMTCATPALGRIASRSCFLKHRATTCP